MRIYLHKNSVAENGDWLRALRLGNSREMLRHGACPAPFQPKGQRTLSLPVAKKGQALSE